MTTSEPTKSLSARERAVLARLFEMPFAGRDELRLQFEQSRVTHLGPRGSPALVFTVPDDLPKAPVVHRIPVEAAAEDVDGVLVHFILHVVDGRLSELEVFREDGESIQRMPRAASLSVSCLG